MRILMLGLALTITANTAVLYAQSPADSQDRRSQVVDRGLKWLARKGQAEDGTFSSETGIGITAIVVTAALRNGRPVDDPMVSAGLKAVEAAVKPDGGIYTGRIRNYETCVAMMCLAEANDDGRYDQILGDAEQFIKRGQIGVAGDKPASDPWYGGVGYGGPGRPDLSNTSYFIEALRAAGAEQNDPAIQRAIAFVSRCQNLDDKYNDTPFAAKVNDGGFFYTIPLESVDPESAPDRYTPDGGLRSYGSMTYAGLKSMIFAGLTEDDPRVKAATEWIRKHYGLDSNPGMGSAGLYYYYHTFAASLNAAGLDVVKDDDGVSHDWRAELIAELGGRQNRDGSWVNDNRRWLETEKNLATGFALLALSYCQTPEGE